VDLLEYVAKRGLAGQSAASPAVAKV